MPKHKAAKQVEIKAWLSANQDCREGRFVQLGNSFLFSEKVKTLSCGAFHLFLCMAMESGGRREFKFPKSSASKYGIPHRSFLRRLLELVESGFIMCKQNNRNIRQENVYAFCFDWKRS